jgi:hypothetical protein
MLPLGKARDEVVTTCAFCGTPLPKVDGQLRPWRAASGQFFCTEFCADDAEEALFQSRGKSHRTGLSLFQTR